MNIEEIKFQMAFRLQSHLGEDWLVKYVSYQGDVFRYVIKNALKNWEDISRFRIDILHESTNTSLGAFYHIVKHKIDTFNPKKPEYVVYFPYEEKHILNLFYENIKQI